MSVVGGFIIYFGSIGLMVFAGLAFLRLIVLILRTVIVWGVEVGVEARKHSASKGPSA